MAINFGSKGAAVIALQSQLNKMMGVPKVDGDYGNETEKALATAYQMLGVPGQSGLASDELIGALTAAVGPGGSVIGSTPPGGSQGFDVGEVVIGPAIKSVWPKVLLGGLALGVAFVAFSKK